MCGSMTDPGPNQFNSMGNGGDGPIVLMPEGKESQNLSHIYRKQMKLREGNVFSGVCLHSVHGDACRWWVGVGG